MKTTLEQIAATEIDHEPTGGQVLARVIRLERTIEKLAGFGIEEILAGATPVATAPPVPQPAAAVVAPLEDKPASTNPT
jgi:hypothetical protein